MALVLANGLLDAPGGPPAHLRIEDGVILRIDRGRDVMREPGDEVVDLGGRRVLAGLRDAHTHFTQWAMSARDLALGGARSAAEAADLVAATIRDGAPRPGGILRGTGFADARWPDAPTAALLDAAAPDVPVVLWSHDYHSAWMSSPALALCSLADHPTGLVGEDEAWAALGRLPSPDESERDAAIADAVAAAAAMGVTEIVDLEFYDNLAGWQRRARAWGSPGLRVACGLQLHDLDAAIDVGLTTGEAADDGAGLVTVGPLKLFTDGALGSRTAYCYHPYPGRPHDRGRLLTEPDRLAELLARARRAGIATTVHAIGDAANAIALDAYERSGGGGRIEHAQLLRGADLARFAALGVTASVQPAHATSDRDLVETHWAGQTGRPYAFRSLLAAGARLVLGSDAPVEPLDPWRALGAAVTRTDDERPPWQPEEALELATALAASTRGPIALGAPADLTVVDHDPATVAPGELGSLGGEPVFATLLAGSFTHRRD